MMSLSNDVIISPKRTSHPENRVLRLLATGGIAGGKVDALEESTLPLPRFAREYMAKNEPVVIKGVTNAWPSNKLWIKRLDNTPDFEYMSKEFGKSIVQVAKCGERYFSDQKRVTMTLREFLEDMQANPPCDHLSATYAKDWHFVREFPGCTAYYTPEQFADDWMAVYWDALAAISNASTDDYRFVYVGPKHSWTPLHRDVFCSNSWSANVVGRKLWLLFPPDVVPCLVNDKGCVYNVLSEEQSEAFPEIGRALKKCRVVWQEAGEAIFVPSGWYHQVHNLEDTVSINHNWMNVYCIQNMWDHLQCERREAKNELAGYSFGETAVSEPDESNVQKLMKAQTGINYSEFCDFLLVNASQQLQSLAQITAEKPHADYCQKTAEMSLEVIVELLQQLGNTEAVKTFLSSYKESHYETAHIVSKEVLSSEQSLFRRIEEIKAFLPDRT